MSVFIKSSPPEKGLKLMYFDCSPLSRPVEEFRYVTSREERLQRKKPAGETGSDLQVQPLWEDRLLLAASPCVQVPKHTKSIHFMQRRVQKEKVHQHHPLLAES